ncbi:cytochrome P450 [Aspergillus filifer]
MSAEVSTRIFLLMDMYDTASKLGSDGIVESRPTFMGVDTIKFHLRFYTTVSPHRNRAAGLCTGTGLHDEEPARAPALLSCAVCFFYRWCWIPLSAWVMLRKFPSPSPTAAISPILRAWHNVQFRHYVPVHEAHGQLGTQVRIAPDHISILHPGTRQQIYGHGANMLKADWFDAAAGPHRNLADARDKAEHQAKRKMLAHISAAKTVVAFGPLLRENLGNLLDVLDRHEAAGQKANMRRLLNYLLVDIFGQLLYGHKLGCLEHGDDLLVAESKDGRTCRAPFIDTLLDVTVINNLLAIFSHAAPTLGKIAQFHPYKKKGYTVGRHQQGPRVEPAIWVECSSMMNAGTETTTAAMTNSIYLLYSHPPVLQGLRDEIMAAAVPADDMPTYNVVSMLPYLCACIEESLDPSRTVISAMQFEHAAVPDRHKEQTGGPTSSQTVADADEQGIFPGCAWRVTYIPLSLAPGALDTSNLPPLDYVLYLFQIVRFPLGQAYRLFEEDSLVTHLHGFYDRRPDSRASEPSFWFVQFLMVLALGNACFARPRNQNDPLGSKYFARAIVGYADKYIHREGWLVSY